MRKIVNMQTGEVTIDAAFVAVDMTPQETLQEKTARIDEESETAINLSHKDKAMIRVLAELLQGQIPGMTTQAARQQIRQSFKAHYAAVRD